MLGAWRLTRYQAVHTFLRQPDLSKDYRNAGPGPLGNAGLWVSVPDKPTMLQLDPPDDTRLRSLVSKAFTPKAVEALKPRIQAIADGLLKSIQPGEPARLYVKTGATIDDVLKAQGASEWLKTERLTPSYDNVITRSEPSDVTTKMIEVGQRR